MPPFQQEGEERHRKVRRVESRSLKPFGVEHAEGESLLKPEERPTLSKGKGSTSSSQKPFAVEESSGSEREEAAQSSQLSPSRFSLGWSELTQFAKSTAWSKKCLEEKNEKAQKRAYDNSKRTASAKEPRPSGIMSANGACLAKILGIGTGRLSKTQACTPDLRCGLQEKASSEQADSVRSFFHRTYMKLAEPMPDKFIRRGRAKKVPHKATTIQGNDEDSDSFAIPESEDEDDSALLEWLDKFTVCDVCEQVKSQLHDKLVPLEEKLGAATAYRAHLQSQYEDRSLAWQLCDVGNTWDGEMLVCWLDAMEQAKFAIPRCRGLRTASATSVTQISRL
eukprot:s3891_g7.t1